MLLLSRQDYPTEWRALEPMYTERSVMLFWEQQSAIANVEAVVQRSDCCKGMDRHGKRSKKREGGMSDYHQAPCAKR